MTRERKIIGAYGEDVARKALEKRGYTLLARNYCIRGGEIDLIMEKGNEIVFVEVKTRRSDSFGSPLESITPQKKNHIMQAAKVYLCGRGDRGEDVRFFAVAVTLNGKDCVEKTEIIEDIFI